MIEASKDDFYGKVVTDKDKCGRGAKNAVSGCFITLDNKRGFGLQYALLVGHIDMNEDHTEIQIPIHGSVMSEKWETHDANYVVVVKGKNLEVVAFQLNAHKRESLHNSKAAEGSEPAVDSITVQKML